MGYRPIEDYGIIGDTHSVALVGTDGSIDWLCFPHFDSPSVFAAVLDDEKGEVKIVPAPNSVTRGRGCSRPGFRSDGWWRTCSRGHRMIDLVGES